MGRAHEKRCGSTRTFFRVLAPGSRVRCPDEHAVTGEGTISRATRLEKTRLSFARSHSRRNSGQKQSHPSAPCRMPGVPRRSFNFLFRVPRREKARKKRVASGTRSSCAERIVSRVSLFPFVCASPFYVLRAVRRMAERAPPGGSISLQRFNCRTNPLNSMKIFALKSSRKCPMVCLEITLMFRFAVNRWR